MTVNHKNFLLCFYATVLTKIALFYKLVHRCLRNTPGSNSPTRIVLLISRAIDVELLSGLHKKAQSCKDTELSVWIVDKCVKRNPNILTELNEKNFEVGLVVSFPRLCKALSKFMWTDAFLTTVESTTAMHKLPHVLTRLANAVGTSTYTMQHGFENVGLNYCDEIHGPEVKFAAKTVLTWGPVEELPAWVEKETRDKSIAVGCPKQLVVSENNPSVGAAERPIIGVFDNLHWHRYNGNYISTFLNHLEEITEQRREFRFVLKAHPDSIRNRSKELTTRLCSMGNLEVIDLLGEEVDSLTTPWLLSHALGVITTPSTIALDGALAKIPVAVTRYGLDLTYYSPLCQLDNIESWQRFLDRLMEKSEYNNLKLDGERFLKRVLVPGDTSKKILDLMTGKDNA
jgi:hypothetical protein